MCLQSTGFYGSDTDLRYEVRLMSTQLVINEAPAVRAPADEAPESFGTIHQLGAGDEREVLSFLGRRPLQNVVMAGHILDNGLDSEHNRGAFYGCRGRDGRLEGVVLLGHATLMDAHNEGALDAFGRLARTMPTPHVIMGEQEVVAGFWR